VANLHQRDPSNPPYWTLTCDILLCYSSDSLEKLCFNFWNAGYFFKPWRSHPISFEFYDLWSRQFHFLIGFSILSKFIMFSFSYLINDLRNLLLSIATSRIISVGEFIITWIDNLDDLKNTKKLFNFIFINHTFISSYSAFQPPDILSRLRRICLARIVLLKSRVVVPSWANLKTDN
jgi:hypothetical protein